ncbi:hypothetical protein MAPG_00927 [Magnaporthiopsis poae ATCC 64411]|uniref:Uncharacterized protein n=1 Tax=Magnaporthiopsis poae (strain ATCC 64411 / 73-15) TaxID=644358 RepID=A0A0C4DMC2_MAGP6|nr:hypothetical protein MAPG_00927 [Magnaporthiopsis poae ATCC 64411]
MFEEACRCLIQPEQRLPTDSFEYYGSIVTHALPEELDLIQLMLGESGKSLQEHRSDLAHARGLRKPKPSTDEYRSTTTTI